MLLEQILLTAAIIGTFVSLLFILSVLIKRNDIADIAWGTGILIVAVTSYFHSAQTKALLIITVLTALWGVRLTLRILLRNIKKSEDFRYKACRDSWGKWFYPRSYLQVYLLQGFLMVVVGYPFIHASVYGENLTISPLFLFGVVVWSVGYFFEVVGDYQLDKFIQSTDNRGKIMSSGLWRYTRHPNYFGEVTMWWGIFLMVLLLPYGYLALVSPLMITFLILKVSGIPLLEQKFADDPAFQDYKKHTSVFFPWPPKNTYE